MARRDAPTSSGRPAACRRAVGAERRARGRGRGASRPGPEPRATRPSRLDPELEALFARFEAALGDGVVEHAESLGTLVVRVRARAPGVAPRPRSADLDCDFLSFVSGIDWMPAPKPAGDEGGSDTSAPVQPDTMTFGAAGSDGRFQVFGHVQSTRHWGLTIKTDVSDGAPVVDSWVSVYPGAPIISMLPASSSSVSIEKSCRMTSRAVAIWQRTAHRKPISIPGHS